MPQPRSLLALITAEEARDFLPGALGAELRSCAARFAHCDPRQAGAAGVARALGELDPEVIVAAWQTPSLAAILPGRLRYVCYLCGSVRKLISRQQIEQGLVVTNWGGSISPIVAEWALFHILSCLRRATAWALAMHLHGGWKNGGTETASLMGRTVGLHGFGRVARELVKLLRPFNVRIRVMAPDVTAQTEQEWGVERSATLEALFAENDIIVELAPLIPATRGIITEKLLRLIRPGGVFVNVGRGAVVDEPALLRVAREGVIQIGLDVFSSEPLPADSPLRGLPNVTLTPHLAGPTTDRRRDAGAFALRNLQAYAAGRPLEAVITPEVYDYST